MLQFIVDNKISAEGLMPIAIPVQGTHLVALIWDRPQGQYYYWPSGLLLVKMSKYWKMSTLIDENCQDLKAG